MARPRNTVTITNRNKEGTMVDIWEYTDKGRVSHSVATTTILKAIKHYKNCPFVKDF